MSGERSCGSNVADLSGGRAGGWSPRYAAVTGTNQMLWLTFAPLTTEAAAHYGVSVDAIGWLSELFPLLYVLLAIPGGLALDRWFRPSLGLGVALNALGAVVRVVSPSYSGVLVGQI